VRARASSATSTATDTAAFITAIFTPTSYFANTPTVTWTPEVTPTPDVSRFILSAANPMPASPLVAPQYEGIDFTAEVRETIQALHRRPSLPSFDAESIDVGTIVDRGRGHMVFTMICNFDNKSCAPAALLKYSTIYDGVKYKDIVVLILKIKQKVPNNILRDEGML
jgi:hypothetical protein